MVEMQNSGKTACFSTAGNLGPNLD